MRRLFLLLALVPFLVGCGKAEREATKAVLTNAYTAKAAVADLQSKYSDAFQGSGTPSWIEERASGWAGVMELRKSAEGVAAEELLSAYEKPIPVEKGFKRYDELKELSLVTAELVKLALEPRGTWISYGEEMNGIRTRFERAILSLETETKEAVITEAKALANSRIREYVEKQAKAVAEADESRRREEAESQAAIEADRLSRQADIRHQEELRAQTMALERGGLYDQQEAERKKAELEAGFKRSNPKPEKLQGGTFPKK